jgi:mannose-6-phosphate isomerase class I
MQFVKYRWSRNYESAEEDLFSLFDAENMQPQRVTVDADSVFHIKPVSDDTTIWCAEGSMVIDNQQMQYSLQAGDALLVPAESSYTATCGFTGCAYYVT